MQQGAGNFHPPAMPAIEFAYPFAPAFGQGLAGQFRLDPQGALAPGQAMQRRVIAQVLLDAEVQVEGALLKHHAQLPERRAWRSGQRAATDADVTVLHVIEPGEQGDQG